MCAALLAALSVTAYAAADWTELFESGQGSWGLFTGSTWSTAAAPAGGDGSGLAFYDPASATAMWVNRAIPAPDGGSTRVKVSCDFYTASIITASSRAALWVSGSNTSGANNQMFRIGTYNNAHYVCQYYAGSVGTIDTGISGSIGWHKVSILFDKANKMVTWKFDNAWGTYANANYGTFPTFVLLGMNVSNGGSANGANVYFDNVVVKQLGPAPTKPTAPVPSNGAANVPTNSTLSWTAGTNAVSYDVYLGTSPTTLAKVSSAQAATSYASSLVTGTTYYWRVDSLDADGNPTVGDVWMFTTPGNLTATSAHGLCLGSGNYAAGANASVSVTPDAGYVFMKWSTTPDGSDTVSTLRSFTYTMPTPVPPAGVTLYAIMEARQPIADIIVESRDDGYNFNWFSHAGFTTSAAKSLAPGLLAASGSQYCSVSDSLFGANRYAQYAPDLAVAGNYSVYVTWGQSTNGCRYVTHEVDYAGGGTNLSVWNQNQDVPAVTYGNNGPSPAGGKQNIWNSLGTFPFDAGTNGKVKQYSLVPDLRGDPPASVRIMADAVKFQFSPPKATSPTPANEAFKVTKANPVLSWMSGGSTVAYDVYFGTSPTALTKVSSLQGTTSYTCGTLAEATTYYWRVDSVNNGTTTGDVWSFITVGPAGSNYLVVKPNPAGFGTCTGAGYYMPAATAHVTTATVNATQYEFLKWTSDLAGNSVVSTSAAFDYTMPGADAALYAQYKPKDYSVTVAANPSAGGLPTIDGGAMHGYGTSVTIHASIPTDGYCFVNWSTNADGTGIVSRKPDYTFTMPASNCTFYANYAKAFFADGFEGLVTGNAFGKGTLDMNYLGGANQAANGDKNSGNAWWGTTPPNQSVGVDPAYSAAAHAGSNAVWSGKSASGRDYVNLAYRTSNADFSSRGVYVDWWFYDPCGTAWDTGTDGGYCDDALSLGNLSAIDGTTDYGSTAADYADDQFLEKISLGMADDWCTAAGAPPAQTFTQYPEFDPTKYQARVKNGYINEVVPYANGWCNTNVTRSVGWHHARIVLGGPSAGDSVLFYIDDMSTAALSGQTWTMPNAIELVSQFKPGVPADTATVRNSKGAMYDDIVVGVPSAVPSAPTASSATGITATAITWNWTPAGTADGYRLYDAATLGAQKGPNVSSPACTETALVSNTLYSRWVAAYNNAVFESARTALTPVYTLAAVPALGTNVATTAAVGGFYSPSTWPGFTNPQTFGTDNKVSSFKYKWSTNASDSIAEGAGTAWTTDGMTAIPASDGTYYLYLRSYNAAGVGNGSTKLGAYVFDSTAPTGSVVINSGAATTSTANVTLTLSATDTLSGIDKMSFSNDNSTWSTPEAYGTTKTWQLSANGGLKTVYVKFTDKAGNSFVANDTITYEDATAVARISDLWPLSNGPAYKLSDKVVTGVVGGAFWIEETDRSAAIKVTYSGAVTQGNKVDVTGVLDSSSGQRVLVASSVTDKGAGAAIKPLGVVERSAGGKGVNANTPSIANGSGLYNVGMLVRIAGSAGFAGANFFYLDDGSGLTDGANMGIKVLCGAVTPPTSGTKTVTGLVGVEAGKPVLIIRGAGDIQ